MEGKENEAIGQRDMREYSPAPLGLSPLVQAALSGQLDTEKLAELLAIQKEYEANEARKAFYVALADFKRHPLTIYKDKHVKFTTQKGVTEYNHSTLGSALEEINPVLGKCGLSLTWETVQEEKGAIQVTAILSHSMGYSKATSLRSDPDESGGKNKIQAIGSTTEYLKRYTGFALLGISSKDMDDDGKTAEVQTITEEQVNIIHSLIHDSNIGGEKYEKGFFDFMKVSDYVEIKAKDFQKARAAIQAAISAAAKRGKK